MSSAQLTAAINTFAEAYHGQLRTTALNIGYGRFNNVVHDLKRFRCRLADVTQLVDTAETAGILAPIVARTYRERARDAWEWGIAHETVNANANGVTRTRYPELGYVWDGPYVWRIVDQQTHGRVGPVYRSAPELLADLDRFAGVYGATQCGPTVSVNAELLHAAKRALQNFVEPWTLGGTNWEDKISYETYNTARAVLYELETMKLT